jgi:hypothetical protein
MSQKTTADHLDAGGSCERGREHFNVLNYYIHTHDWRRTARRSLDRIYPYPARVDARYNDAHALVLFLPVLFWFFVV